MTHTSLAKISLICSVQHIAKVHTKIREINHLGGKPWIPSNGDQFVEVYVSCF